MIYLALIINTLVSLACGVWLAKKHLEYRNEIHEAYLERLADYGKGLKELVSVQRINYRAMHGREIKDVNGRNVAGMVQDLVHLAQQLHRTRSP